MGPKSRLKFTSVVGSAVPYRDGSSLTLASMDIQARDTPSVARSSREHRPIQQRSRSPVLLKRPSTSLHLRCNRSLAPRSSTNVRERTFVAGARTAGDRCLRRFRFDEVGNKPSHGQDFALYHLKAVIAEMCNSRHSTSTSRFLLSSAAVCQAVGLSFIMRLTLTWVLPC